MKRFMFAALFLGALTSCEVNFLESPYDRRDHVTGYYDVEEYSQTFDDYTYYSLRVTKDSYSQGVIYLDNFYAVGITVRAYLNYDDITIPYQVVDDYEIEGSGTFQGRHIDLSYRVKDLYNHAPSDYCNTWGDHD